MIAGVELKKDFLTKISLAILGGKWSLCFLCRDKIFLPEILWTAFRDLKVFVLASDFGTQYFGEIIMPSKSFK